MTDWDAEFAGCHAAFAPFADLALPRDRWPSRDALNALLRQYGVRTVSGHPVRVVAPPATKPSDWKASYEGRLYQTGELVVGDSDWHDLLNVLVWCRFPHLKAAINARHHVELSATGTPAGRRGRVRDAVTLLDESGCLIACSDVSLADDLREHRWYRLFHERRGEVGRAMSFLVVGHALLEKALRPYLGMTARCLILPVDEEWFDHDAAHRIRLADAAAARLVRDSALVPELLAPLPILGIPGWSPDNDHPAFYLNEAVFRPVPRTPP